LVCATAVLLAILASCADVSGSSGPADPDGATKRPTLSSLLSIDGTRADNARHIRSTESIRQQLIVDCMVRRGLRYVAYVVAGQLDNPTGLPIDLPAEEFRRRYGYGISTGFENALKLKPTKRDADPNEEIVVAMSEADRKEYRAVLGNCQNEASKVTDKSRAVVEEFGDELDRLFDRIDSDRRVAKAERSWAACMAKAGYPYQNEQAVADEITHRMNPLYDSLGGEDVPEGVVDLYKDRQLTTEQQNILTSVKNFELAIANADQNCRGDLDQVRRAVRDEYEAKFVDDNRARLRQIFPDSGL